MRLFSCCTAALALALLVVGCNTVSPDQCWPNTTGGFGGSGSLPIGAGVGVTSGDFGSAPQSAALDYYSDPPNPCIEPPTPCLGKCLTSYEATAAECGRIANEAQRKTCQDGAYAAYRSCAQACQQSEVTDPIERCKKVCDRQYEECCKPCTTNPCYAACMNIYKECLKDCKK